MGINEARSRFDYGTVQLAEWDSCGAAAAFERLAATLRDAVAEHVSAVEHVGSNAVPGLVAKPILDIALGLRRDANLDAVSESLQRLGYEYHGDKGNEGGFLFILEDRPRHRIAHVHVVGYGDAQWRRYIAIRERLRAHAAVRRAYANLKRRLARQFPDDRGAYIAAKETFIAGSGRAPRSATMANAC